MQEVRKSTEYRQFAEQVIQQEADSLQRLGLKAPHLAPWITSTSRPGSHTSTAETETSGSAETELRPAKRQRTQAETELQAQLDDLESQNKQAEMKLKVQQQLVYQKALQLQMQEQTQAARTLAASQQVGTPIFWSHTQQLGQATAAPIAPPFLPHGVQATTAAGTVPLLEGSIEPLVESIRMSGQPARTKAQLHNPDIFQSKTIAGRYSEWADDGKVSGIKCRLVPTNRGMGLPRAGHTCRATDNLRGNRNLPEAIDKLIERGLTRPAALELVRCFRSLMAWTAYLSKVLRSTSWHTRLLVVLEPNSWERQERLFRSSNWHLGEKWRSQQTSKGLRREIASLLYMQYWLLQLTVALGSKLNLRQVTGT